MESAWYLRLRPTSDRAWSRRINEVDVIKTNTSPTACLSTAYSVPNTPRRKCDSVHVPSACSTASRNCSSSQRPCTPSSARLAPPSTPSSVDELGVPMGIRTLTDEAWSHSRVLPVAGALVATPIKAAVRLLPIADHASPPSRDCSMTAPRHLLMYPVSSR